MMSAHTTRSKGTEDSVHFAENQKQSSSNSLGRSPPSTAGASG